MTSQDPFWPGHSAKVGAQASPPPTCPVAPTPRLPSLHPHKRNKPIHPPTHPPTHSPIHPPTHPPVHSSIHVSIYPSVPYSRLLSIVGTKTNEPDFHLNTKTTSKMVVIILCYLLFYDNWHSSCHSGGISALISME